MSSSDKSLWEKTKTGGKAGFDKIWGYADKLGAPVNKLSNKLGSEAFWPTTLDKEADKAARILRSFCKDGFYQEESKPSAEGPEQKQRVLVKIPTEVIKNAKGLAIFTTMRTGLWISGAGGSGIVVAKMEDGSWSPPTGILLHTAGLGFLIGVDIYDCVLVLNTQEAVDAFTKVRCTLGSEISVVAGPVGVGGVLESEVHKRRAPIFTYLKSRGFYAGVQIDGSVIIERTDENARFYGSKIPAAQILKGAVHSPIGLRTLTTTLQAAQGDQVDESYLPNEPPPADYEVVQDGHAFGIPDKGDPDPYGVHALEQEGMQLNEASTHSPAANSEFEFHPRQNSPAYATFNRQAIAADGPLGVASSGHRRYTSIDHSTQTDLESDLPTQTADADAEHIESKDPNPISTSATSQAPEHPPPQQPPQLPPRTSQPPPPPPPAPPSSSSPPAAE